MTILLLRGGCSCEAELRLVFLVAKERIIWGCRRGLLRALESWISEMD